jgi:hypothetical protein
MHAEAQKGAARRTTVLQVNRLWSYVVAFTIVALVVAYQHFMQSRTQIYGVSIEELSKLQEKQLDAFLAMNQLLVTLGIALLTAMGFLLINGRKVRMPRGQLWVAVTSTSFVGLSLYFGYKAYDDILFMLQPPRSTFNLYGSLILGDRVAHFATLMIGAFLFVDFAFQEFSREDRNAQLDHGKKP